MSNATTPYLPAGKTIDELTRQEAARLLLAVQDAEASFLGFVKLHHPEWDIPDFQLELIDVLDRLEKRQLLHPRTGKPVYSVILNMPPRHNKSTLATKLFPAYCMARAPHTKILVSAASQPLADGFGASARQYIQSPLTHLAFPDIVIDPTTRAKHDWAIKDNIGQYLAIGLKGTTIGRPANLLIVDDPYSGRQAAESPTQRIEIKNHWEGSLILRREPDRDGRKPITVLIHTRWHPNDLTGEILEGPEYKEGLWLHFSYKGIIETQTQIDIARTDLPPDHPRWLPRGELQNVTPTQRYEKLVKKRALWPERFPLEELERTKRRNEREFAAQYQQEPYVAGGNLIKEHWWRFRSITEELPRFTSVIIAVDAAFKKTDRSDFTAIMVLGLAQDGDIHILDLLRKKMEFPVLKRTLTSTNARWRGAGLKGIYIEDKAAGTSLIQELRSQSGLSVIPYKVVHDKVARVNAITPLIEGGRVVLPQSADWLEDFLRECEQFPSGSHDDQVDALSMGLEVLARMPNHDFSSLTGPLNPTEDSLLAQIRKADPARHGLSPLPSAGQGRPGRDLHSPDTWSRPLNDLYKGALGE